MKGSRFSAEKIIRSPAGHCAAMSREGDTQGASGKGMRSMISSVKVSEAKRLKAREVDNAEMKKLSF